jgi:DUF1680 family protein
MMPQRTATTTQRRASAMQFASPGAVQLGGILGEALAANHRGRLAKFIVDETSPAIALFAPPHAHANHAGDWYGEHAGKWLYAASKAAARTSDAALSDRVRRVADYLVSVQDTDGYLGNYASERRFMRQQPPKPVSWDGAPSVRTWDIWTHSYLILGLLEVHRLLGTDRYLEAARRIGDLCWRTLTSGGIDITDLGNHHGMSATVLMDPAMELHFATGEQRYLDLATLILEQANRNPRLALLTQALAGADASEIATGKAYQLIWNVVGLAKLHRANGDAELLRAAVSVWRSIRDHHLTLGGGPWGGVGHRSREVFKPRDGLQSLRLRRDLLDAGVGAAQSRVARDHGRGRVCRGDRAQRVQRSARRTGARRRRLVLLLVSEWPPRLHDLLALLQVERCDGARGAIVDCICHDR